MHTTLLIKEDLPLNEELFREFFFKVGEPAALFLITLILYLTESPNNERAGLWWLPFLGGEGGLVVIA